MIRILGALLLLLLSPYGAQAAGEEGPFALEGVGSEPCKQFTRARKDQKSQDYALFVGWIYGYLSAYNQFNEDTVDIIPWQGFGLLDTFLSNYCQKHPKDAFAAAVGAMTSSVAPMRLQEKSEVVEVSAGDKSVALYEEILRRAQKALAELGYYEGEIDGVYGKETRTAFKEYQRDNDLDVTGLPDQGTLYKLFR